VQTGSVHPLEASAQAFAEWAHGRIDHRRKYTEAPYTVHLAEVVALVRSVPHTPEMLAAAWLHDTVEDTGISLADIERRFGAAVAALVAWLTNVSQPADGAREVRKGLDRKHSAASPAEAQTLKLADVIANVKDVAERDPVFAAVYIPEKRLLVAALRKGDPILWRQAAILVGLEAA
jgi:(p)ppGpp synthase/HD superfamily hydrolase